MKLGRMNHNRAATLSIAIATAFEPHYNDLIM